MEEACRRTKASSAQLASRPPDNLTFPSVIDFTESLRSIGFAFRGFLIYDLDYAVPNSEIECLALRGEAEGHISTFSSIGGSLGLNGENRISQEPQTWFIDGKGAWELPTASTYSSFPLYEEETFGTSKDASFLYPQLSSSFPALLGFLSLHCEEQILRGEFHGWRDACVFSPDEVLYVFLVYFHAIFSSIQGPTLSAILTAGSHYYGSASRHLDTVLWDVSQTDCSFLTQANDLAFINTLACMNEPGSHRALWH
ncbi:hypothetical protein JEQ12_013196 [Ovis aries]|uniref:Uncharacterized protein n=1 Tax=Ovis aries TaxID=9940 RepID=A0A835ZLH6_SHEEP|nr:hypothetical protein JEQ12_013196 [Ovis aries]